MIYLMSIIYNDFLPHVTNEPERTYFKKQGNENFIHVLGMFKVTTAI